MVIIDCEVYRNYFLLSAKNTETGKIINFESLDDSPLNKKRLASLMCGYTTVSFNGYGYDLIIISAMLSGYDNSKLKDLSDEIIKSNLPSWKIAQTRGIEIPSHWDHIDLMEVAPGAASLKFTAVGWRTHPCKTYPLSQTR